MSYAKVAQGVRNISSIYLGHKGHTECQECCLHLTWPPQNVVTSFLVLVLSKKLFAGHSILQMFNF